MRKLLTIVFLVACMPLMAQVVQQKYLINPIGSLNTVTHYADAFGVDTLLFIPTWNSAINMAPYMNVFPKAAIAYDLATNRFVGWSPTLLTWQPIGGGGGGPETDPLFDIKFAGKSTDDLTEGVTSLYYTAARAALKVGITDTAAMLSSYTPMARILNINGVAQDLSQDRTWTITIPNPPAQNLQQVTDIDSNTTHRINAPGYDFKSKEIMTRNGNRFFYYDSAAFGVLGIGRKALANLTTGGYSVAIGDSALYSNTTGVGTAIGYGAMKGNVVGQANTAMGYHALYVSDANANSAFGNNVLASNTTGINNTAIGSVAIFTNTTGADNTAIGYNAMALNTTGSFNTGLGDRALATNSTGSYNIGIGYNAANGGLTGNYNLYAGRSSGRVNTGSNNVFLGDSTGYSLTSGDLNVFIGAAANWGANGNYGGSYYNTIVGASAGLRNRGNYNTLLGFQSGTAGAGGQFWTVNHAIIIGDQVDYITTKDYQINIGNRIYSDTLARIGILQKSPQYTFDVLGTGRFTDTAFGKTMGNADSSLALATTAFVKNQKYGGGGSSSGGGATPTLQQVTDAGSSTTNDLTIANNPDNTGAATYIFPGVLEIANDGGGSANLFADNLTLGNYLEMPNSDGTFALSATINGNTVGADVNGNINLGTVTGIRKVTSKQREALKAREGDEIYDTDFHAKMVYDGDKWEGFRYRGLKFQGYDGKQWVNLERQ